MRFSIGQDRDEAFELVDQGSKVINMLDRKLTFAYVMNKMSTGFLGDERSTDLFAAVIDAGGAHVR